MEFLKQINWISDEWHVFLSGKWMFFHLATQQAMGMGNPQYGQILDDAFTHPLYEGGCPLVIIYTQL